MRGKRNPKPACGHEVKGRCSSRRCLACSKVQAGSTIVGGQVTVPAECSVLLNNSIFHCEKCFANSVDRTCAETKRVTITAPDGSQSRYCNEAKDFHPLEAFEGLDTTVCRPCTNRRRFASPHALRMNMHAEQQSRMQLAGQKRALPQQLPPGLHPSMAQLYGLGPNLGPPAGALAGMPPGMGGMPGMAGMPDLSMMMPLHMAYAQLPRVENGANAAANAAMSQMMGGQPGGLPPGSMPQSLMASLQSQSLLAANPALAALLEQSSRGGMAGPPVPGAAG